MIVHLGHDDAELQAVTVNHEPYGSAWRQRDYDVVTSPEFRRALEANHVVLVKWRDIARILPTQRPTVRIVEGSSFGPMKRSARTATIMSSVESTPNIGPVVLY